MIDFISLSHTHALSLFATTCAGEQQCSDVVVDESVLTARIGRYRFAIIYLLPIVVVFFYLPYLNERFHYATVLITNLCRPDRQVGERRCWRRTRRRSSLCSRLPPPPPPPPPYSCLSVCSALSVGSTTFRCWFSLLIDH
jgi:hypothetical protein